MKVKISVTTAVVAVTRRDMLEPTQPCSARTGWASQEFFAGLAFIDRYPLTFLIGYATGMESKIEYFSVSVNPLPAARGAATTNKKSANAIEANKAQTIRAVRVSTVVRDSGLRLATEIKNQNSKSRIG